MENMGAPVFGLRTAGEGDFEFFHSKADWHPATMVRAIANTHEPCGRLAVFLGNMFFSFYTLSRLITVWFVGRSVILGSYPKLKVPP
jgi:hypothetical protein